MTDRELDALVAEKVMGWRQGLVLIPGMGGMEVLGYIDGEREVSGDWSPSTSIADAWQIVERMTVPTGDWCYNSFRVEKRSGGWWAGHVTEFASEMGRPADPPVRKGCFADTAPKAICLAALKAVGVEVDND